MGGAVLMEGESVLLTASRVDVSGGLGGGAVELSAVGTLTLQDTEVLAVGGGGAPQPPEAAADSTGVRGFPGGTGPISAEETAEPEAAADPEAGPALAAPQEQTTEAGSQAPETAPLPEATTTSDNDAAPPQPTPVPLTDAESEEVQPGEPLLANGGRIELPRPACDSRGRPGGCLRQPGRWGGGGAERCGGHMGATTPVLQRPGAAGAPGPAGADPSPGGCCFFPGGARPGTTLTVGEPEPIAPPDARCPPWRRSAGRQREDPWRQWVQAAPIQARRQQRRSGFRGGRQPSVQFGSSAGPGLSLERAEWFLSSRSQPGADRGLRPHHLWPCLRWLDQRIRGGQSVQLRYLRGDRIRGAGVGGSIELSAAAITLQGATVDASGQAGGGTIHVGGGFQGNPLASGAANAATTTVSASTVLRADALHQGMGAGGGVVGSGHPFFGTVSGRGGEAGGDGGLLEVSGKDLLQFGGQADASAPQGMAGTLLLDPKNIIIDASVSQEQIGYKVTDLVDPNPQTGDGFGTSVLVLANGNIVP